MSSMSHCSNTSWTNFAQLHRASIEHTYLDLFNRCTFLSSVDRYFLRILTNTLASIVKKSTFFNFSCWISIHSCLKTLKKSNLFSMLFATCINRLTHFLILSQKSDSRRTQPHEKRAELGEEAKGEFYSVAKSSGSDGFDPKLTHSSQVSNF